MNHRAEELESKVEQLTECLRSVLDCLAHTPLFNQDALAEIRRNLPRN